MLCCLQEEKSVCWLHPVVIMIACWYRMIACCCSSERASPTRKAVVYGFWAEIMWAGVKDVTRAGCSA